MDIESVVAILNCPNCSNQAWEASDQALVCRSCARSIPFNGSNIYFGSSDLLTADWQNKQSESVSRYENDDYNRDETVPLLFGAFMSPSLRRDDVVIDIGCGIDHEIPAYVRELGLQNYFGLEPLADVPDREFPCLVGAVAEKIPLVDQCVDSALLATSIDHIEDIDEAMTEILRVLKENGKMFLWVGLYEPAAMAKSKSFYNMLYRGRMIRRVARAVLFPIEYLWFLFRLFDRRRRLKNGIPIDSAHCRYFTEAKLDNDLEAWGFVSLRKIVVPGTSSVFVEAHRA